MFLNLRVLLAAFIFVSFHVLIDNVPLATAKGNDQQRAIFYRFPDIADGHGPSPANFRHNCMLVSRDEDGKWHSGKKLECVIWSNSKYNNVLGKMRKRKKGQGSDKKKEIGNDLLGTLFGIFGIDIGFKDTRNNGICFQLWLIGWTILYTVFLAVVQKVVTHVKSWVSKERLDSGRNDGMPTDIPLPSENEVKGEMTSKDAATQTDTQNYPGNTKQSTTEQLKDLKNDELACKLSIDNANFTTEALQVSSKDISSEEGQSISTGTSMQMEHATTENGSFDECPSDSTTTLDSKEEPEVIDIIKENEIKREGVMYPDYETFLMNVSHFDRFYSKERVRDFEGSSQLETRNSGCTSNWIFVDHDLICNGKELKEILGLESEDESKQENHVTSENQGKEPTKLSAQSSSKRPNAVCDKADSFDDDFVNDSKTGGIDALTSRLGKALDKEPAVKKGRESSCKSSTDESGALHVENQGDVESVQNPNAADVKDSASINESRQCKLDEARDNDFGKVFPTVTTFNALEYKADDGESFDSAENVVKMQSSVDLESITDDFEVGQEKREDNPYDFSDVVETGTLFDEESSVTPSDDTSSFTDALEDAKYFGKDSKEIKENGLLYLDGEQNAKPIYPTDCDRQDEVVQAKATEDVLPLAILVETETSSERDEMHHSKLQSDLEEVRMDSRNAAEECLSDGPVDRNATQCHQCDTAGLLENQGTDNASTSVCPCEQESLIPAESTNISEHQTTGGNKDGKRMTSLRQENSEVMVVYRNDSGIDCADNSPLTMTDRCTDSLDKDLSSNNANESSLLSVVTKQDDDSTCHVDDDSVEDAEEPTLASGNDDHVEIEEQKVSTDDEMIRTSTYVESDTVRDDKCIANLNGSNENGKGTQKTQDAEEDHGSESKSPTLGETLSESTLTEENNEFDESLDANLLEMFWGEILANYNAQQLMENFELLREEMNKEESKAESTGVARNALLHQSNEVSEKSATEKNKDKNAASKDAVIPLSQNTQLSLLMDMPLRNGSAMVRRIDPLKAMRFWLP